MRGSEILMRILGHLQAGGRLVLFLDYDGTLVPIARTPAEAQPDGELLGLLADLARAPTFDPILLSGRPLAALEAMLPVPGLTLAGTYGVEIRRGGRTIVRGADPAQVRHVVEQVKAEWECLTWGRSGFLLEDKGLAIALHARWAEPAEADLVLEAARAVVMPLLLPHHFRILTGDRFLEVAPAAAHKGQAVDWVLDQIRNPNALPVYFGDDDKDEEAFAVVRRRGGIPIGVGERFPLRSALGHLPSPEDVRVWLRRFLRGSEIDVQD
ncbi:trehalose-phosphatase [Thermoflexus sp.]|uniref:trehalose-phosphatase n=1 Tax=Thermoflexus sp. TaxID=1969742 RepID=UPI0035E40883